MDTILVVNAGSSDLRFHVYSVEGEGRLRQRLKGQMNGIGRPQLLDRPAAGLRVRLVPDGDVALRPFVDHPVAGRRLGELVVALDPPLPVEQEEVEPDGEDRVVGRSHHVPVEHGHVTAADRVAGRPEPVPGVADELLVRIADAGHDRVVPDRLAGRRQVRPVRSPQPLDASAAGVVVRLVPDFDVPVNEVGEDTFSVLLIPHTLSVTTFAAQRPGDLLNLEVDQMARYAARLIDTRRA